MHMKIRHSKIAEQAAAVGVRVRSHPPRSERSERGNRWCERIWTVLATCNQQGRSVFAYLAAAVSAWFQGGEAPSLLPLES